MSSGRAGRGGPCGSRTTAVSSSRAISAATACAQSAIDGSAMRPSTGCAVTPGARPHRGHRKAVGLAVAKAILELRIALHLAGQRVDEGEQLRHGAEAVRDRPARRRSRREAREIFAAASSSSVASA